MKPCMLCGAKDLKLFLDLGATALANKFLTKEEMKGKEPAYPLRVAFCPACTHVQLLEHVPPGAMFDDYLYISSMSETLKAHLDDLASIVTERFKLGPKSLVVDIGCNDGTLLSGFKRRNVKTLGVDPAKNLVELARKAGVETFTGLFGEKTAKTLLEKHGPAAAITSTNSFPHIQDLNDFLKGVEVLLAPDGVLVIEAHYLQDILDQVAFDTVYHEHVSYWALKPMAELFARHGLEVVNAERLPLHHGQLRVSAQRKGKGKVLPSVAKLLAEERKAGLPDFATYEKFAQRTSAIKKDLTALLKRLKKDGKRVAGYGAPAKGSTLLSYLEIGPDSIEYIVDRSPLKQGRYTPGMHIPVVPTERLLEDSPDYVLLLAWNFVDEIMEQQAEYRRRGGKFIVPVPEAKILDTAEAVK